MISYNMLDIEPGRRFEAARSVAKELKAQSAAGEEGAGIETSSPPALALRRIAPCSPEPVEARALFFNAAACLLRSSIARMCTVSLG